MFSFQCRVNVIELGSTVASERYLYSRDLTQSDFAPRLALRCLRELQQAQVPVTGAPAEYRERLLEMLKQSLQSTPASAP